MIHALRWLMLVGAIVLGVAGFTLSGLILAVGSVLLDRYDTRLEDNR